MECCESTKEHSSGSQIKSGETEYNSSNQLKNNRYSILSDVNDDNEVIITTQGQDGSSTRKNTCIDDDNEMTITTQGQDGSSSSKDKCIQSNNTQLNRNKGPLRSKSKPNQEQVNKDESKSQQSSKLDRHVDVAIVGDSMIKYVNPAKLRKSLKRNVNVKTFPGAIVADMHHYVKPTLNYAPDYLIMHVGTNDLKQSSPHQISTSIANLGQEINKKFPTTKLIISELITRNDDPQINTKVKQVNTKLSQVCTNNKDRKSVV